MHGTGSLFLRDGGKLEGDFDNNKVKAGILTLANGDLYAGEFDEQGKYTGYSMFVEKSTGKKYTGEYLDGKKWGEGSLKFKTEGFGSEKVFMGKWKNDLMEFGELKIVD